MVLQTHAELYGYVLQLNSIQLLICNVMLLHISQDIRPKIQFLRQLSN